MTYGNLTVYQAEKVKRLPNWLKTYSLGVKVGDIVYRYQSGTVKWKNANGNYINLGLTSSYTKVLDDTELVKKDFEKACNDYGFDFSLSDNGVNYSDHNTRLMFSMFKLGWESKKKLFDIEE